MRHSFTFPLPTNTAPDFISNYCQLVYYQIQPSHNSPTHRPRGQGAQYRGCMLPVRVCSTKSVVVPNTAGCMPYLELLG